MMYDEAKGYCPVPGSAPTALNDGLEARLGRLNGLCGEMLACIETLYARTYGDNESPKVATTDPTISGMIDSALEKAQYSLDGLQSYLTRL